MCLSFFEKLSQVAPRPGTFHRFSKALTWCFPEHQVFPRGQLQRTMREVGEERPGHSRCGQRRRPREGRTREGLPASETQSCDSLSTGECLQVPRAPEASPSCQLAGERQKFLFGLPSIPWGPSSPALSLRGREADPPRATRCP